MNFSSRMTRCWPIPATGPGSREKSEPTRSSSFVSGVHEWMSVPPGLTPVSVQSEDLFLTQTRAAHLDPVSIFGKPTSGARSVAPKRLSSQKVSLQDLHLH